MLWSRLLKSGYKGEEKMGSKSLPLVSIVTPVYNNGEYLAECIESVLAQTYPNWDYTIVNNCSTDGTGEVARRYAAKNRRIKVLDNKQFLRAVPNHNQALRQISPESKYCKIVFGDDWIFPRCLEEMVAVAEEHPSVGIVGAYGLWEVLAPGMHKYEVMLGGLPYPSRRVSGRDVCRRMFLDELYLFGTSTSVLYRSDLVRQKNPFYNEGNIHADIEACVVLLKSCDFGFVHQILTFTRGRKEALGMISVDMRMDLACRLHTLTTHGRCYLDSKEFEICQDRLLSTYYNFLAVSAMRGRRDKKFWEFHKGKIKGAVGFSRMHLATAVVSRMCRAALNPYESIQKLRRRGTPSPRTTVTESNNTSGLTVHANGLFK
jgi:glycosyltransferase involved in cell wall biosynthesis